MPVERLAAPLVAVYDIAGVAALPSLQIDVAYFFHYDLRRETQQRKCVYVLQEMKSPNQGICLYHNHLKWTLRQVLASVVREIRYHSILRT